MKNHLFTIILFFSIYISQAQIVNIPNHNFKNTLINTLCVDTTGDGIADSTADFNNDGEIQVSEAEAVLWLNVNDRNIRSLEGIQSFKNITFLDCGNNLLTELDLSQNTDLKEIRCQNNQISDLDFSQNSKLIIIYADNNDLVSLNIKNGQNTMLAELDATNNSCLGCIRVDDVNYASNASNWYKDANTIYSEDCIISFLDPNFKNALLNHNSNVIDINRDGEIQYSEAAKTIGLSISNENISSMEEIEYFCNLKYLYCADNQIETLDFSRNTKLRYLQCQRNGLTNLDVSNCLDLEELLCASNELATLDISQNYRLKILSFPSNQLTNIDVSHITNLERLSCSRNNLTSVTTGSINVRSLTCDNNYLTNIDVSQNLVLNSFRCNNNLLTSLNISNNLYLEELIVSNNQILTLDVSPNNKLKGLDCGSNNLKYLNVSNGINWLWYKMHAKDNPNLYCIQVDDETASYYYCNPPNNGWCKDSWASYSDECILGIVDLETTNLQLFPNPTQNILYVNTGFPIDHIKIYTLQGQLISETKTKQINVSSLSSGLYFASIIIDGKNIVKKFIKE